MPDRDRTDPPTVSFNFGSGTPQMALDGVAEVRTCTVSPLLGFEDNRVLVSAEFVAVIDDGQDVMAAEDPALQPSAPSIVIHVHGNVMDEQRLINAVATQMLRSGARRSTMYRPYEH